MAAYPKYNSRVRLSIGYNARGWWTDLVLQVRSCWASKRVRTGVLSGRVLEASGTLGRKPEGRDTCRSWT